MPPQSVQKEGRKDAASPLGEGVTSYLGPLSLQTQEAQVHHEVPWGLLVLSGLRVLPCQDLLKMDMASLTVRIPCQGHGQPLRSRGMAQSLFQASAVCLALQPRSTQDQSNPVST